MNIRTVATVAIALLLGVVAMSLVHNYVKASAGAAPSVAAGGRPVVVAARAVERGVPLSGDAIKIVYYPADAVPEGAFDSVAALSDGGRARRALLPLSPNQPILPSQVSGPRATGGLSVVLQPGMRAVSVRTDDVAGVGGFVMPGDHVDVLVTRQSGEGDAALNSLTQTVIENVRVLGVDQAAQADKPVVTKAVTLEVSPAQAQTVALAQTVGTVRLSLRNEEDDAKSAGGATTVADLGGAPRAPAAAATVVRQAAPRQTAQSAPVGPQVRVTRGVQTQSYAVVAY